MKANINITQGESTKKAVEKAVEKYLTKQDRVISIKEAYEVLSKTNATISRMTEQGFENIAGSQIMQHAMKFI